MKKIFAILFILILLGCGSKKRTVQKSKEESKKEQVVKTKDSISSTTTKKDSTSNVKDTKEKENRDRIKVVVEDPSKIARVVKIDSMGVSIWESENVKEFFSEELETLKELEERTEKLQSEINNTQQQSTSETNLSEESKGESTEKNLNRKEVSFFSRIGFIVFALALGYLIFKIIIKNLKK